MWWFVQHVKFQSGLPRSRHATLRGLRRFEQAMDRSADEARALLEKARLEAVQALVRLVSGKASDSKSLVEV